MDNSTATLSAFSPKCPRQHERYWSGGLREANRQWRNESKRLFVARLGGKCQSCGFDGHMAALEFDHLDPATKKYEPGAVLQWKDRDQAWGEISKCRLLCSNCHRIESFERGHLGGSAGKNKTYTPNVACECARCGASYQSVGPSKFCSARCRTAHKNATRREEYRTGSRPRVVVTEKKCSACQEVLPAARFYANRSMPDGLYAYCKTCFCSRYARQKKVSA